MRMLIASNLQYECGETFGGSERLAGDSVGDSGRTVGRVPHGSPHRSEYGGLRVHAGSAPVAQLDRADGFYPSGSAFESRRGPRLTDPITRAERVLIAATIALLALLAFAAHAQAATSFQRGVASSYGPGLFGNRTACGQTLTPATRGVAHRSLPCGTRLQVCRAGRCTHARVVDRGPFVRGRVLDLTSATTRELCSCSPRQWGHRTVAFRRRALA